MTDKEFSLCKCKKRAIIHMQNNTIDKLHLKIEKEMKKNNLLEQKNNILKSVLVIQFVISALAKIYNL